MRVGKKSTRRWSHGRHELFSKEGGGSVTVTVQRHGLYADRDQPFGFSRGAGSGEIKSEVRRRMSEVNRNQKSEIRRHVSPSGLFLSLMKVRHDPLRQRIELFVR